jgi:hypothetical protein
MTSIKTISITAASLAAGLSLLSVSGNAAQANPHNTFGVNGGCDSFEVGGIDPGFGGGFVSGRNCEPHRDWVSDEARRNRRHSTQSQLIGLGGGLIGHIINGSQQRRQQEPARPSNDLALIQQQQEIELLKMKLQMQQQQQSPYGYQTVSNTYPPAVQPVYPRPSYGHYQQTSYQRPAYQQPTYQQPVYQQPAYHQPQPRYHY